MNIIFEQTFDITNSMFGINKQANIGVKTQHKQFDTRLPSQPHPSDF
jgi:hypothetical protein